MSGPGFLVKVRSAFQKEPLDWDLSDTVPFDLPHERALEEDETPTFRKLRVIVSGEPDHPSGSRTNGALVNTLVDDDESLLDTNMDSPAGGQDPCDSCTRRRERVKRNRVMKRLTFAAFLYLLFMIGELIGGYIANSLAIMTDALHMLTDLVGIILSLLALWLSSKPPTKRFTFGLHRLEVVSAAISVLLIYILTAVLLNEAIQRTIHQDFDIDGDVMLITAAVGVAVNLIMGFLLNQSGHLHSHSHHHSPPQPSHSHENSHGSLAVRAAFIHALGDLVQSVGVLIAAYIVRFKPEYKIADPICTYIFSLLVLFTTVKIVRDTGIIVLEGVPRHLDVMQIREDLLKLEDVHSVEDLNVWALTPDRTAALVHLYLVPSSSTDWEEVQEKARLLLLNMYGISKCTIQLQCYREASPNTCSSCQVLSA